MQVIDGQQRLTTLFIILTCLHAWARQQGNEGLEQRTRRMLFMEADPLDPSSASRRVEWSGAARVQKGGSPAQREQLGRIQQDSRTFSARLWAQLMDTSSPALPHLCRAQMKCPAGTACACVRPMTHSSAPTCWTSCCLRATASQAWPLQPAAAAATAAAPASAAAATPRASSWTPQVPSAPRAA